MGTTKEQYNLLTRAYITHKYSSNMDEKRLSFFLERIHGRVLDLGAQKAQLYYHTIEREIDVEIVSFDIFNWNDKYDTSRFVVGDGFNLPFMDNTFDCVVLGETIEHVDKPALVLLEVLRVLKLNTGKFVGSTPRIPLTEETHVKEYYTQRELTDLIGGYSVSMYLEKYMNYWLFECS